MGQTYGAIWHTGGLILKQWEGEWFYQELEMTQQAADLNFLNSGNCPLTLHHSGPQIGNVVLDSAFINNGGGYCNIRFLNNDIERRIIRLVKNNALSGVSLGASGDCIKIPKRNYGSLRTLFYRRWSVYEIAVVKKPGQFRARILI